jgi:hypothetical protein
VTTSKPRKRNIGAIVGGILGGAGAILAVIGIAVFVQLRRRRARPRRILSVSTDFVGAGPLTNVTPFDPNSFEATQDSGISTDDQPLVTEDPEAEMVALRLISLSSTPPAVLPRSRPVAPIPAGITGKEIARLRAEVLSSQQSHNHSTSNSSRSTSSPNTVTESSSGATSSYNPRRLHTEVESLVRQEMERLRTQGLVLEAPPSYTEGDR